MLKSHNHVAAAANPARRFLILSLALLAGVLLLSGLFRPGPALAEDSVRMIPATFAEVAAKAGPAVVNISTVKLVKGSDRRTPYQHPSGPNGQMDPFQEFFERFFGDRMPRGDRKERSLGSGFIIDASGLIITNNHVVEGADDIVVRMSDERELHAEILGRDPKTDLALIKIKGDEGPFPYLELGDSTKTRIGDWVLAIGNPFGLESTVTAGILSARGRSIGAGPYDDFLQTDASINPGNSGGPLLNLDGEVIGINTAIVAGGQGIGFAIPTVLAKGIVTQLRDKGRVVRGWLGVMIQKVTPELAKSFDLESEDGALVADVAPWAGRRKKRASETGGHHSSFSTSGEIKDFSDLPSIVAETPGGFGPWKSKVFREQGRKRLFPLRSDACGEDLQDDQGETRGDLPASGIGD